MISDNTDGSEVDVGAGDDDREQDGAKVWALIFLVEVYADGDI